MGKTIVVLGGSLAGLAIAHQLLKHTRPHVEDLKVILVSKNSHFYWNLASVRAVIPGLVSDDQILGAIEPGLAQYPPGSVEFLVGTATAVDAQAQTATVELAPVGDASTGSETPRTTTISYDQLVLATGARPVDGSLPWKAAGSYEELLSSLHGTASRVLGASHIVVAGGGATGVELSGEIRDAYPDTKVVLLSGEESLVGGDWVAGSVKAGLLSMGVEIRTGTRVTGSEPLPDGKTKVLLEGGEELITDLYLTTMGQIPNSEFLPDSFKDGRGFVEVDDQLRVKAATNIWAAGDIVSKPRCGLLITEAQAVAVAKNLDLVLQDKEPVKAQGPWIDAMLCSLGPNRGVGRLNFVPMPSLAVWIVKGRTLGIGRTPQYVSGSRW